MPIKPTVRDTYDAIYVTAYYTFRDTYFAIYDDTDDLHRG
jgi:hypothetical protein